MEFLSAIVSPIVESLLVPVKKHLGYLVSATKLVTNMKSNMKTLDGTRADVQKHMDTNNISNLEIPTRVPDWLGEVEKIKTRAQGISCTGIGCFDLNTRYRVGKSAFKTTEEIKHLIEENHEIIWRGTRMPLGKVSSYKASTSTPSHNLFKSRDQIFKEALGFLQKDDTAQVIALFGMGGVGKTTMMEQLKKTAEDKNMFDWIAKVVIGQQPNMFSIQQAISEYIIGKPLIEKSITARAEFLCMAFKEVSQTNKNKVLIILDDVWERFELNNIGLSSPLPTGFKLLLTSRKLHICRQIAGGSHLKEVRVDVIEESEARDFFCQITKVSEEQPDPELNDIRDGILRECGFLPLAIRLIAETLKSQEKFVWRDTLQRLKENDLDEIVQKIIEISYNFLKGEERDIFLLCGLFPDDFDIPIEDLTRYAWGLNLLNKVSTLQVARDRTKTCVHNLKNASLLLDSDYVGCVKLHDLVLAYVVGRVSKDDQPWVIKHGDVSNWSKAEMSETCKRMSLTCMGMSEFPRDFKYPNLSLLRLMRGDKSIKFPEDFYDKMENLEVIAYEKMQYPLLPRSLRCSTKLRTLCLDGCFIMFDCSPIGDLLNLEVLSFAGCGIRKLPATIGNLKKLKLLDLTGCIDLHIDDGIFKNLVNLEELCMRVDDEKGVRLTETTSKELAERSENLCALEIEFFEEKAQQVKIMSFKKLERFRMTMGCFLPANENKKKHSFENTLMLVTNMDELLESGMTELFHKTEVLCLQVDGMNDVVPESVGLPQHSFYNLRVLKVYKCSDLRYLLTVPMVSGLVKLERPSIKECPVMEVVVYNETGGDAGIIEFQKLKYLSFDNLPKLVGICNTANVIKLPELMKLYLRRLPNFTTIYPEKRSSTYPMSSEIKPLLNKEVVMPKLEVLSIRRMEKLECIWPSSCEYNYKITSGELEVEAFDCMLREIKVCQCDNLVNLFPTNPMRLLHRLERLEVGNCGSIQVLFNIDVEGEIEEGNHHSSSLRDISVSDSKELRWVWRVRGVALRNPHHQIIISGFQALERMVLYHCGRFIYFFTPTLARFHFPSLIYISLNSRNTIGKESVERSKEINDISKGEILQVDDHITESAFLFHLIPAFHHLQKLDITSVDVEVVFEIDGATQNNQQPPALILLFPHLKHLSLSNMKKMQYVWKCNWNNILFIQKEEKSSFQNLRSIHVYDCKSVKYLFSPLMIKFLSNLETITILKCDGIEEVISKRDDGEMVASSSHTNSHLKLIDGGGVTTSDNTSNHDHAKGDGASGFPFHKLEKLEKLVISNCPSMRVIFEIEGANNKTYDHHTNVGDIHSVMPIQRSTNTNWLQLMPNLKILNIYKCDLLEHLFTSSTLESLKQLKELTVEECKAMQVIVKEDGEHTTCKPFEFPRLRSLTLADLPNVKGFFLGGRNEFQWPLLDKVEIYGCPQMKVFTPGHSVTPELKYIHTGVGKHSLECGLNFQSSKESHEESEIGGSSMSSSPDMRNLLQSPHWSFSNLFQVDTDINSKLLRMSRIIFPCDHFLKLQNLEKLHVSLRYYDLSIVAEEVFEVVDEERNYDVNEKQSLSLSVFVFPKLKEITLEGLWRLRHMWKSNRWVVLNFPNLTKVSISWCRLLGHVFTNSMVGSLLQLQDLQITDCDNMEVIIKQVEEDFETRPDPKVVVFPCLKSIKLYSLGNLKGFCLGKEDFLWQSLDTLEIKDCPQIRVFTSGNSATPVLKYTTFGSCYTAQDPNSFIKYKQQEGMQF